MQQSRKTKTHSKGLGRNPKAKDLGRAQYTFRRNPRQAFGRCAGGVSTGTSSKAGSGPAAIS